MDETDIRWQPLANSKELYHNFRGSGDKITILSPKGAQFLSRHWDKYPLEFLENIIHRLIYLDPQGCYSIIDKTKWAGYRDPSKTPDFATKDLEQQDRMSTDRKRSNQT